MTVLDEPFGGYQMRHSYRVRQARTTTGRADHRDRAALAHDPAGDPGVPESRACRRGGRVRDRRPGVVGRRRDRWRRRVDRRRPDLGRCRARRRGARSLGVALVAVRVGRGARRARALLPRARRGRERAAARAAVEPRRLREQRGAARRHRDCRSGCDGNSDLPSRRAESLAMLVAACSLATALAVASTATPSPTTTLRLDGVPFAPELALTSAQQQRGLMFRRKRTLTTGCSSSSARTPSGGFWMKNTLVPLTIVFFDSDGQACAQALDDALPQGSVRDLRPGQAVPLRARAAGVGHPPAPRARPAVGARPPRLARALSRWVRAARPRSCSSVVARRPPAALGQQRSGRRYRPRPRPPRELRHRADRSRLVDAEDQGRRRHARRGQRTPRGRRSTCASRSGCAALLEHAGVKVVMTRTRTAGTSIGNVARARIANRAGAALFLRIHADGSTDPGGARDAHALPGAPEGVDRRRLRGEQAGRRRSSSASCAPRSAFPDRGLQERSDFTGFNWADVPVILVEMGFMTNPTEDRLLATDAYQRRAAVGLCRGTLRFLGRSPAGCG